MNLRLIKGSYEYKKEILDMLREWRAYNQAHPEANRSPWAIFRNDEGDFDSYLEGLDHRGSEAGMVPDSTYFCLDEDRGILVGAVNIRHSLNDYLLQYGGHIGDGIIDALEVRGALVVGVQVLEYRNRGSNKVAIIIPGGGYSNVCSFCEGWPIAQELFERGYNCFVLYYRVFPNAYMPNPIEDVARLVKRIKENYPDLDLNGYLLLGFSAGGHLAGIWATKKGYYRYGLPKPKYIALAYPVIDLSLNKGVSCQNCLHKDCSGEDLIRYSVFTNVDKDYPVTYLWQGKRDQCISFDNSVVMDKVLKENDVKHKYVVYDDTCHGFGVGVGTCAEGWIDKMIKYFESADEA